MLVDESQPPSRSNRRWVLWTILGIAAFLIAFAVLTLPRTREEFVGTWRCEQHPKQVLTLHSNGNFNLHSYYKLPGYRDTQWFDVQGDWVSTKDTLFLTATKVNQEGRIGDVKKFDQIKRKLLNRKKRVSVTRLMPGKINLNLVEEEWSQQSFVRSAGQ